MEEVDNGLYGIGLSVVIVEAGSVASVVAGSSPEPSVVA